MSSGEAAPRALRPEDLDRLFLERANAGDVDGVVDLYEPGAVLVVPPGRLAVGTEAIREVYAGLLTAARPRFTGVIRPAVCAGDIALTSRVTARPRGAARAAPSCRCPCSPWTSATSATSAEGPQPPWPSPGRTQMSRLCISSICRSITSRRYSSCPYGARSR